MVTYMHMYWVSCMPQIGTCRASVGQRSWSRLPGQCGFASETLRVGCTARPSDPRRMIAPVMFAFSLLFFSPFIQMPEARSTMHRKRWKDPERRFHLLNGSIRTGCCQRNGVLTLGQKEKKQYRRNGIAVVKARSRSVKGGKLNRTCSATRSGSGRWFGA